MAKKSIEDDPRFRRPVETTTSDIIEKVEKLVLEDGHLKIKQLSALVGVSDTTILRILHDHLGMTKVSAKWVPIMLTPLQKHRASMLQSNFWSCVEPSQNRSPCTGIKRAHYSQRSSKCHNRLESWWLLFLGLWDNTDCLQRKGKKHNRRIRRIDTKQIIGGYQRKMYILIDINNL